MALPQQDTKQEMLELMQRFKKEKFHPLVAPSVVTTSEANVVVAIYMAHQHKIELIQPRAVAAWLHLTPSALSQTLKSLEEKGFIERNRTSSDSRVVSLTLTEDGFRVAQEITDMYDELLDRMIDYIGEKDIEQLMRTLEKVLDFLTGEAEAGRIQKGGCPDVPFEMEKVATCE